jgi:hypothetical protein
MADTVKLVQGSNSLDLHSGDYTTLLSGVTLTAPPPRQTWHTPDQGEPRLVRSEDDDRQCVVRVEIQAADEDTLQNDIVAIRRYLKEAIRYELHGDNNAVYLQLQKDGATNGVNHRIKSGYIDDTAAHYGGGHRDDSKALDVFLNLVLAPYGEMTSVITLNNDLASSPHFVEWSSGTTSPSYADGWSALATPTTAEQDTTAYLIGGASQHIAGDAAGDGIQSDVVANASDTSCVMYCWIYLVSGSAKVRLRDTTGGTDEDAAILSSGDSGGVSDKSAVDAAGNTWYRVPVSTTSLTSGNDVALWVICEAAAADFYIDGAYVELGVSTAPDAFMSARAIDNRNDIQSTSAATENYLNYIDVWGIPGDAPAWMENKIDFTTIVAGSDQVIMGRHVDGSINIGDIVHWIESDEFSAESGTGTSTTGSGTSDDHYHILTDTGSAIDAKTYGANYTGTNAFYRSFGARHMYGIVRASSTSSTFTLTVRADALGAAKHTSAALSPSNADTWELIDFGAMDISATAAANYPDSIYQQVQFKVLMDIADASGTCWFDALIVMPVTAEHFFIQAGSYGLTTSDDLYIEGQYERVFYDNQESVPSVLGTMWEVEPGTVANRLYYIITKDADENGLTNAANVQLRIIPRTRHLLGT